MTTTIETAAPRRDGRVIGLVSAGHFFSHFYMLLLPPLFPLLRDVYGVGYTELGFAVTVFSLTSGLTQAPIGFLVDRYGAIRLLVAGVFLESLAIALIGVFPFYGALLALMVLAGLANSVYHPADYVILNASIDPRRMGRAFSIHTFSGYLGSALAPIGILSLLGVFDWRSALVACGLCGVAVAVLLALNASALQDSSAAEENKSLAGNTGQGISLLLSAPILMGMLFFVGISMASHGFGDFGVATLTALYPISLGQAGLLLSAYLFAAPVGVLLGGWVADRVRRHDLVAAGCFVTVAAAVFVVAAADVPVPVVAVAFVIAGLGSGLVAPSRDMMIRSVTPPGQMGKVFGFVSTGFNIGGIVAPLLFGYMLDHTEPRLIFWALGGISLLTVATVLETGRRGRRLAA